MSGLHLQPDIASTGDLVNSKQVKTEFIPENKFQFDENNIENLKKFENHRLHCYGNSIINTSYSLVLYSVFLLIYQYSTDKTLNSNVIER